ncbi:FAD-binding protein [Rhizobium sp. WYCCWR 11146]|uniref:FAD-binding protein n=1 Tax=Rhizobium sp. WYCCWR 11146 TaxID=2749833 RepID=UPI0015E6B2A1|nr:FAD-binding protein [Rhizobium sp. WYCCWR 11146]MBA1344896.1 FAD-binding protein [Rhizobium sp. WYCCWR 11146]
MKQMQYDVVVLGSGGAGLLAALSAASQGLTAGVFEKSHLIGGTTAISGGGIWIPKNHVMQKYGFEDVEADGITYLTRLTLGEVDNSLLIDFLKTGPDMLSFLEEQSELRFFSVDRPDYHPGWPGARAGRSVEPLPFEPAMDETLFKTLRYSHLRQPVTSTEGRKGLTPEIIEDRQKRRMRTQGAALVAGLAQACARLGVQFHLNEAAIGLSFDGDRCVGVETVSGLISARLGVVLSTGGFEWNSSLVSAYLPGFSSVPTTPPGNEGDGLRLALRAGAAVANMTEAWWTAAYRIPGDALDGQPLTRNMVRELALPGSIMVNQKGERFVNEASSYNDLGMAFNTFDPGSFSYPNRPAWLIFDHTFKSRYAVASVSPQQAAPEWMVSAGSIAELAERLGVSVEGLTETVDRFNVNAREGTDPDFARGDDVHGLYYGDPGHGPNPCVGPLDAAPFYAVEVLPGNNGTKGGLKTTSRGKVVREDGSAIDGLFACGNVAASIFGKGYPGHGGSLGPILTAAYTVGLEVGANQRR